MMYQNKNNIITCSALTAQEQVFSYIQGLEGACNKLGFGWDAEKGASFRNSEALKLIQMHGI